MRRVRRVLGLPHGLGLQAGRFYQGNTFDDSPDVVHAIAANYSEDDKKMGWWGRYGVWVLGGLFVLGGVMTVLGEE